MRESTLLELDGVGNLLLGVVLLALPQWVAEVVGLPAAESRFYPTVLGAILFGIGIALLLERFRSSRRLTGLGLAGALCINLSFGIALAAWLLVTGARLTALGTLLLWALVAILVGIGSLELAVHLRAQPESLEGDSG